MKDGESQSKSQRGGGNSSQLTTMEPELYNQLRGLQKSARELRQVIWEYIRVYVSICEYIRVYESICECMGVYGSILEYKRAEHS